MVHAAIYTLLYATHTLGVVVDKRMNRAFYNQMNISNEYAMMAAVADDDASAAAAAALGHKLDIFILLSPSSSLSSSVFNSTFRSLFHSPFVCVSLLCAISMEWILYIDVYVRVLFEW